jgi:hypothetical protein
MAANTKYSVNKKFIQPFIPLCDRKMTRVPAWPGHSFAVAENAPSPASFFNGKDQTSLPSDPVAAATSSVENSGPIPSRGGL